MILSVDADGYGSTAGTHVSAFVHLMRGEYDDNLCWPFRGDITLQLINRRSDEGHIEVTVHFADGSSDSNADQVMEGEQVPTGLGYDLIPHSALLFNECWNTEYLKNDYLEFQVTGIEAADELKVITALQSSSDGEDMVPGTYSRTELESNEEAITSKTEHVTDEEKPVCKTSSAAFSNTHTISHFQLSCESTESDQPQIQPVPPVTIIMKGFISCKMRNIMWFSPPFYSHIGGYKFCLSVDANGHGSGAGTHMSLFVNLMRGEYDDNLFWPFRGTIKLHMVSHRAYEGHVEMTVEFDSKAPGSATHRVTERERALSGAGSKQFIPHSALGYNSNTGFLEKDSLEFQVTIVEVYSVSIDSRTAPGGDFGPLFGEEEDLRRALRVSLQEKAITAYMHST